MRSNRSQAVSKTGSILATALACTIMAGACARTEKVVEFEKAPVILISIDTLRADHLPIYGYEKVSTPAIDQLASDAVVFENAYCQAPLTLPSHVSILTGLLPPDHGVRNNIGFVWDTTEHPPITSPFKAAGYETGAAVSAYVLRGSTGIGQAFDFYDDSIAGQVGVATGQLQRSGKLTAAVAKRWISEQGEQPFFFMLHLFEPHSPYEPPQPYFDLYADKYDGEIAAVDEVLGEFLDFLRARGIYDRATIVLLSDHGEGLNDHGEEEHGVFLYREAIHVPLLIKLPHGDKGGTRISSPVQLIDVAPTLLQLGDLTQQEVALPGVSLLAGNVPADRRIYSETLYPRFHLGWSELRSLIDARHHYIEAPLPELYDHVMDPGEARNILADQRRVYASLRTELDAVAKRIEGPSDVDPEEAAKLAALGYIGTVQNTEGDLPDPKTQISDFEKMKSASRLTAGGRQAEAVTILRELVGRNPRFADAWSLLADAYVRMGNDGEAIEAYKGGLRNCAALKDEMALSLAGLLLKTRRLDEAEEHARLAIGGRPVGAHQMLARIAIERGEFDEAEKEARLAMDDPAISPARRATTSAPPTSRMDSLVLVARAMARRGELDAALALLLETRKDADELGVHVESLEFNIGDILATQQHWAEAEHAFNSEIEHFPGHLQAYTSLAVVRVLRGQYDKVDLVLNQMVQANPGRASCLAAAETLEALGDDTTAARWRRQAENYN